MGTKVDGMLILQPFQQRCRICGSMQHVKEIGELFLCQRCIQNANQAPCYSSMDAVRRTTPFPEEYEEGLEDVCAEECGTLEDHGYPDENDTDYDSDIFMRNHK